MAKGQSIAIVNQAKADLHYLAALENSIREGEIDKSEEYVRMHNLVNTRYTEQQQASIYWAKTEEWVDMVYEFDKIHYVWPTKQELQAWKNRERPECTRRSYRHHWYEDQIIFNT